jgi:fucose permease
MKKLLSLLCLGFIINGFMVILTGTLVTYLMQDCGLTHSQAGFLASIQAAGNLVAGLLSGLVIKRIGRKYASMLYCIMFALGFSVLLYSSSPALIYVCIFISGLGWGLCNNVCHLLVNSDGMSSGSIYFMHTSYALGAFVGPMVLNLLLMLKFGWRSSVWVVVISSLILLLLLWPTDIPEEAPSQTTAKKNAIDFTFLKNKRYYVCFFLYFCYGGVETCINSWLITFLSEKGIMSLSTAQIMLSMLWMVIIVGRLLQIFLEKRIPARYLLLGQSALMLLCITLLALTKSEPFAIALILIIGLFMAGITPANALNAKEFMHGEGVSSGIIFAGNGLGGTLIPFVVGLLFDHISLTAGMLSLSALLLVFTGMAFANTVILKNQKQ